MSIYLKCCVGIWIAAAALIQTTENKSPDSADTVELSQLETVWNNAQLHNDADALDRLWADELIVTVPKMPVMSKPEALGFLRSGRMKLLRYETSAIRTRVYGDAAVVTGRLQRTRSINNQELSDDWRFIKVYIRHAGKWQVVAWQASESAPQ